MSTTFSKEYSLVRKIGQGNEGVIYLCQHIKTKRLVAIKTLLCNTIEEANKVMQEVLNVSQIRHTNIVEYLGAFLDEQDEFHQIRAHIVMPYFPEGDLSTVIAKRKLTGAPFDSTELYMCFVQLASAVEHLHSKGFFHRDIKPANIILANGLKNLKLCDFGRLKKCLVDDQSLSLAGSISYIAPEVIKGESYSFSVDIFSLGCVFLEMIQLETLSGHVAVLSSEKKFHASIRTLCKKLPKQFPDLIIKMLQLKPENRITASDLVQGLSLLKDHFKNDSQTFVPVEIHRHILSYALHDLESIRVCSMVSRDWRELAKSIRDSRRGRFIYAGPFLLDCEEGKIVNYSSIVSSDLKDGVSWRRLNYKYIVQDSFFVYYVLPVKRDKKTGLNPLLKIYQKKEVFGPDDASWTFSLVSKEICSGKIRWKTPLPIIDNDLGRMDRQMVEDSRFVYNLFTQLQVVYSLNKKSGKLSTILDFHENSDLLKIENIASTPNYLFFETKSSSLYRIYQIRKPDPDDAKFGDPTFIYIPNVAYSMGGFFGKDNFVQKSYFHDLILADVRIGSSLAIGFSAYGPSHELIYHTRILGSAPITVDHTCLGQNHWVFHGHEYGRRITSIVDFVNKTEYTPIDPGFFHILESQNGDLIGLFKSHEGTLQYLSKECILRGDKDPKFTISFSELKQFSYPPVFQFISISSQIAVCFIWGARGLYCLGLDIPNGIQIWKQNVCDEINFSNFGFFDIGTCCLVYQQNLVFISTLKSHSFNICVISGRTGKVLLRFSKTWDEILKSEHTEDNLPQKDACVAQ